MIKLPSVNFQDSEATANLLWDTLREEAYSEVENILHSLSGKDEMDKMIFWMSVRVHLASIRIRKKDQFERSKNH